MRKRHIPPIVERYFALIGRTVLRGALGGAVVGAGMQTAGAATVAANTVASTAALVPILPLVVPSAIIVGEAALIGNIISDIFDF